MYVSGTVSSKHHSSAASKCKMSQWDPVQHVSTFFPNEKKSFFHHATTRNSFLRIAKNGDVMTSQR